MPSQRFRARQSHFAWLAVFGGLAVVGTAWLWFAATRPSPVRLAIVSPDVPERSDEIGVSALLAEMLEPSRLGRLPDAGYSAYLASSYERRSVSPKDPQGWFANDDWASRVDPNFVGTEKREGREETVLLDVTGAGSIVRIWTATPTGTLRIYLDGNALPSLAEPMGTLLGGTGPIPPPLAHVTAKGYNLYFPFPFRKSCKITVDDLVATDPFQGGPLERFYYQIHYRHYQGDAANRVRSYRPSDLKRAASLVARVRQLLAGEEPAWFVGPRYRKVPLLEQDEEARAELQNEGGGRIRSLVLHLADTSPRALQQTSIDLVFDGETTVSMNLGEFLGVGDDFSPYRSLFLEVGEDKTVVSRWPMPFRSQAVVAVRGQPGVRGEIGFEPEVFSDRTLLFHAVAQPPQKVSTRPFRDLTFLDVAGQGQYVGSAFRLENSPGARWWGEGDEKIYVDGGEFPTQFGTGTEDYYGYAWSTPQRFEHALHGQPRAGRRGFDGSFSMYRFHLLDAVPFQKSLRFDLELWHWDKTQVTWASTAYYYARPSQP